MRTEFVDTPRKATAKILCPWAAAVAADPNGGFWAFEDIRDWFDYVRGI